MAARWRRDPVDAAVTDIQNIPENLKKAGGNIAAETVGFAGDLQPIAETWSPALKGRKRLPTSEELVERWGDKDHWSSIPAMFAAPGPGEVKAGLLTAKAALKGMLGLGKEATAGVALAQALFHGSPHKFDRFSLEAIGTGGTGQVHGSGLYFSDNSGVAGSYKGGDLGSLYEVEYPDDLVNKMLDWAEPISEQPGALRAFDRIFGDNQKWAESRDFLTAGEAYRMVNPEIFGLHKFDKPGAARTSNALAELGVPGVRTPGGNPAAPDARNIVVFNPDDITSVKRDGELVYENKLGIADNAPSKLDKAIELVDKY